MSRKNTSPRLRATKDYAMFKANKANRRIEDAHLRKLRPSMQQYGWIPSFPMTVLKNGDGRFSILDGQHRFTLAQDLGLSVWFVEVDHEYDVPKINGGQVPWNTAAYAGNFADRGMKDYAEVIAFADDHGVSIGFAAHLLAGQTGFSNIRHAFRDGEYRVVDREYANKVAFLYNEIKAEIHRAVDKSLLLALMAVVRVDGFEPERLMSGVRKLPERVQKFGTRDGALEMLEYLYNYGRRGPKVALKVAAENAMNARNAGFKS